MNSPLCPNNCIPRRLMMNFIKLSSLPFMATYYGNYKFYTYPVNSYPAGYNVIPIGCLSNSTNVTVSTSRVPAIGESKGGLGGVSIEIEILI